MAEIVMDAVECMSANFLLGRRASRISFLSDGGETLIRKRSESPQFQPWAFFLA